MYELKKLTKEGIPKALKRAEHYRLLNEPALAESICLDIVDVDATHQKALITLLLSLTDQFGSSSGNRMRRAREILPKLEDEYSRAYFAGLVCERRGHATLRLHSPGVGYAAYEWYVEALAFFEKAMGLAPPENQEAILRWNTCVRRINHDVRVEPAPKDDHPGFLE